MVQPKTTKLASLVFDRRLELGMNTLEFAKLISGAAQEKLPLLEGEGISYKTLLRIERGETTFQRLRTVRALAAYFDCSPQRILELNEEEAANADSRGRNRDV